MRGVVTVKLKHIQEPWPITRHPSGARAARPTLFLYPFLSLLILPFLLLFPSVSFLSPLSPSLFTFCFVWNALSKSVLAHQQTSAWIYFTAFPWFDYWVLFLHVWLITDWHFYPFQCPLYTSSGVGPLVYPFCFDVSNVPCSDCLLFMACILYFC